MLEPAYLGSTLCRFDHCVSCYLIINVPIRDATEGHRGGREALCVTVCVSLSLSRPAARPPTHSIVGLDLVTLGLLPLPCLDRFRAVQAARTSRACMGRASRGDRRTTL